MKVTILEEAGYYEALYGLGFSFGLTSEANIIQDRLTHNDLISRLEKRANMLAGLGKGHDKFLRQIILWVEVDAPLYWWKQFDQYKVATVTQSESTMHTLMKRPLTKYDFEGHISRFWLEDLNEMIDNKDFDAVNRHLPQSFLQKRLITMSYATALEIVKQRTGHKLIEWKYFIDSLKEQAGFPQFLEIKNNTKEKE